MSSNSTTPVAQTTSDLIYNCALMGGTCVVVPIYLIYFLATYAHPEDTNFGSSKFAKLMVMIGYSINFC
jgi:hypothetical protein